jgi:pyruvate dehydrogenase E1 component alpha subunit
MLITRPKARMTTMSQAKTSLPPDPALSGNSGFSLISSERLLSLYAAMIRCRIIGERASALPEQGDGSPSTLPATGREAAIVGVAISLGREDSLVPAQGDRTAAFVKGVPLGNLLGSSPRATLAEFGVALTSGTAVERLEAAIAAAQASLAEKSGAVAVAFFASRSEMAGLSAKARQRAGDDRLPLLLVCLNAPESGAPDPDYGFPAIAVDAGDVVAIYRVATEAIAVARRGLGPTRIDCLPYPATDRVGASPDPIGNMETYLTRKGLFRQEMKQEITAGFGKQVDAAIRAGGPSAL